MKGRTYNTLAIGNFEFKRNVHVCTFSESNSIVSIGPNCMMGISTSLLHASPFDSIKDISIQYNSTSYEFFNSFYMTPQFIHYSQSQVHAVYEPPSQHTCTIEYTTFSLQYSTVSFIPDNFIHIDAIQFKTSDTSSLCITYDIIQNWTQEKHTKLYKNKQVIGAVIENSVYYHNTFVNDFSSIDVVCIYYLQIIPFTDIFIDDGVAHFKAIQIRNCVIQTVSNVVDSNNCYILAQQNNKYLVAIIHA